MKAHRDGWWEGVCWGRRGENEAGPDRVGGSTSSTLPAAQVRGNASQQGGRYLQCDGGTGESETGNSS